MKPKYTHSLDQTEEIIEIQKEVRRLIKLAQYKMAYKYLKIFSKKYPYSYYIASMLATFGYYSCVSHIKSF